MDEWWPRMTDWVTNGRTNPKIAGDECVDDEWGTDDAGTKSVWMMAGEWMNGTECEWMLKEWIIHEYDECITVNEWWKNYEWQRVREWWRNEWYWWWWMNDDMIDDEGIPRMTNEGIAHERMMMASLTFLICTHILHHPIQLLRLSYTYSCTTRHILTDIIPNSRMHTESIHTHLLHTSQYVRAAYIPAQL